MEMHKSDNHSKELTFVSCLFVPDPVQQDFCTPFLLFFIVRMFEPT